MEKTNLSAVLFILLKWNDFRSRLNKDLIISLWWTRLSMFKEKSNMDVVWGFLKMAVVRETTGSGRIAFFGVWLWRILGFLDEGDRISDYMWTFFDLNYINVTIQYRRCWRMLKAPVLTYSVQIQLLFNLIKLIIIVMFPDRDLCKLAAAEMVGELKNSIIEHLSIYVDSLPCLL